MAEPVVALIREFGVGATGFILFAIACWQYMRLANRIMEIVPANTRALTELTAEIRQRAH